MKKKSIIILLIILFSIALTPKTFPNDFYTAIRCGHEIMEKGVHANGVYTWHEGLKFINIRWLFDIILTLIHDNFGNFAIYMFNMILVFLYSITAYVYARKKNYNILFSFLVSFIFLLLMRYIVTVRAQSISYLLFLYEYFLIDKLGKTGKNRYIVLLFIISVLVANLHGSMFIICLIIYLPYLAEALANKAGIKDTKKIEVQENKHFKKLILAFILSIIGGFCNPNFEMPLVYLIKTLSHKEHFTIITELKDLSILNSVHYVCFIAMVVIMLIVTDKKVRLKDILFFLGFFILTLGAIRMGALLVITCFFWIIDLVYDFVIIKNDFKIENKYLRLFIIICIMLLIVFYSVNLIVDNAFKHYMNPEVFPIDAANYILSNLDYKNIRIYNAFNVGAYLEMMEIPTFIDSRPEIYTKAFNDTEIFSDYALFTTDNLDYYYFFKKYDFTHILVENGFFMNRYFDRDEHLDKIYQDDSFIIYEVINKYE